MAQIHIKTFAALTNYLPRQLTLHLPAPSTVAQALQQLKTQHPQASTLLDSCQAAIETTIVNQNHPLQDGQELIILPPSSGG